MGKSLQVEKRETEETQRLVSGVLFEDKKIVCIDRFAAELLHSMNVKIVSDYVFE